MDSYIAKRADLPLQIMTAKSGGGGVFTKGKAILVS